MLLEAPGYWSRVTTVTPGVDGKPAGYYFNLIPSDFPFDDFEYIARNWGMSNIRFNLQKIAGNNKRLTYFLDFSADKGQLLGMVEDGIQKLQRQLLIPPAQYGMDFDEMVRTGKVQYQKPPTETGPEGAEIPSRIGDAWIMYNPYAVSKGTTSIINQNKRTRLHQGDEQQGVIIEYRDDANEQTIVVELGHGIAGLIGYALGSRTESLFTGYKSTHPELSDYKTLDQQLSIVKWGRSFNHWKETVNVGNRTLTVWDYEK